MLTRLPNRLLAQDRLEQAISHAEREQHKVGVIFIDLDHFKDVNDTLGHYMGDYLLQALAQRLKACLRETDTLSRQGGDEFMVIVPIAQHLDGINMVLNKLMLAMVEPFIIDGHEISITLSIGVSIYPDDGASYATLFKNADIAMYQAKDAGRNSYRFFDERMHVDAHTKLDMINGLRRALERQEFELHYQPQIDLNSSYIIGAEALLRWHHPKMELIPPCALFRSPKTAV